MPGKFLYETWKGMNDMGDLGIDGRTILKCYLKEIGVRMWIEFYWLRIRFSGKLL
jgi:hypothetical protein